MMKLGSDLKYYKVTIKSTVTINKTIEVQANSAGQARIIALETNPIDFDDNMWHIGNSDAPIYIDPRLIVKVSVSDTPVLVD
jgi:hypothetical protein